jgi:hypothetical protein
MPTNRLSNNITPLIPFLESPLFVTKQKTPPTKMACMAALSEIPNGSPNLRSQKTAKVPLFSWASLGLGAAMLPSVATDGLNAAPVLLLILGALGNAVTKMHINSMQNLRIKEYVKALEIFMSNCEVHISPEDRIRIRTQIDSVKKLTAKSYAAYLKQPKGKVLRSPVTIKIAKPKPAKLKAPAVLPIVKRPVASRPEIQWPNLNDASLNYASDAIGNVGKGLAAFGIGLLSVGAAFSLSH